MAKAFKIQRIAVGSGEWDIWLLDSNGRVWAPTWDMETGSPYGKWYNVTAPHACDLAAGGQHDIWIIDAAGKIFYRPAQTGLGFAPEWVDESLTDVKGRFFKATQISTGESSAIAIDDQKRVWQRWHAQPGSSGTPWLMNEEAANAKCVAAGYDGEDQYCLNDAGSLYRFQASHWVEQEIFEGFADATKEPKKLSSMKNVTSLEMGRQKSEQYFYSNLFYLGTDGHMYQPSGLAAVAGAYYKDTVGIGVDFTVRDVNDIWMVNAAGDVYRRTQQTFANPLAASGPAAVTVQGDEYFWTRITTPDFSGATVYWIQKGDTFNQLAADLGTTPADLKAKNKQITNIDRIKAGDPLHLV